LHLLQRQQQKINIARGQYLKALHKQHRLLSSEAGEAADFTETQALVARALC
jgi:hypothetical protein